jgi:N-acetylmuramic acid 6-phosphate (MurNAc-6-P) etherase
MPLIVAGTPALLATLITEEYESTGASKEKICGAVPLRVTTLTQGFTASGTCPYVLMQSSVV